MARDPLSDPNSFKGADNTWYLECPDKLGRKCDCEQHSECKYSPEYYLRTRRSRGNYEDRIKNNE